MAAKRVTLEQWIKEQFQEPDKEKPLSMLSLVHMVGMQQLEVYTVRIGPGSTRNLEPHNLAALLRGKAEVHAQDLPSVQTYNVMAFWGTTEPQARFTLYMNNADASLTTGLPSELPNETGKTQQGMRWFEIGMQQIFRRQQVQDEMSIRLLERADKYIETLQSENRDARDVVFQVMKDKIMNDQSFTMKKMEYERSTAERKKWLGFAPALINNILGREVFPTSTEDTALIETIADNIKQEDIAKLAAVVPAELAGPLMNRFIRHTKKKEEEAKNAEDAARALGQGNPEDDAAGGEG